MFSIAEKAGGLSSLALSPSKGRPMAKISFRKNSCKFSHTLKRLIVFSFALKKQGAVLPAPG